MSSWWKQHQNQNVSLTRLVSSLSRAIVKYKHDRTSKKANSKEIRHSTLEDLDSLHTGSSEWKESLHRDSRLSNKWFRRLLKSGLIS